MGIRFIRFCEWCRSELDADGLCWACGSQKSNDPNDPLETIIKKSTLEFVKKISNENAPITKEDANEILRRLDFIEKSVLQPIRKKIESL